ncbi:MAG: hypothetical protein Q4Q30_02360 [Eggerthella sp.]|nr:hypothetical protein [Eggerthella sp.]
MAQKVCKGSFRYRLNSVGMWKLVPVDPAAVVIAHYPHSLIEPLFPLVEE